MIASWGMRAWCPRIVAKMAGAHQREDQADPVDPRSVRVVARERQQQRDGAAEGRDLGQGEVHEDDPALHHVDAEVGVDAGQDQAGREGRGQELQHGGVHHCAPVSLIAATSFSTS